ncbi:MAG: tRNA ((54)-C5)-methyltransferase [Verrucomicrobiaceae bacterium]|nr:tRNA ((54)-C5)-methyltransferase [Verrucomicrobiaceae bacterium]
MPLPIVDPSLYTQQLDNKVRKFREDFAAVTALDPKVFCSAPTHYRLRAEFRMWHKGDTIDYVMFDPDAPATAIPITEFPTASLRINELMPLLRGALLQSEPLRHRLFQVEFLTTLSGDAVISLVYHRALDDAWRQAATTLQDAIGTQLIGRSRKQKIVLRNDYVDEVLTVNERLLHYRQIEGSFTQPNGGINQQMLTWAGAQLQNVGGDLLELYCGNGNFTIALAPLFQRVLATEISKSSVRVAEHNLTVNKINNVTLVRMSSDEISTALSGGRAFRRLHNVALTDYQFSTLLVDPPRSGLDETTLVLAQRFDNILYISCNPTTLRDNVIALQSTHTIAALALFDQFPYTHHLECGVVLRKR